MKAFVVHALEDRAFVEGYLVKALALTSDEILLSSRLDPGAVIVKEIERGALSPLTIVVLSPAFVASPWAGFAEQLAQHHSVQSNAVTSVVVPLILAECELPLLSRFRVPLDFRDPSPAHWAAEAARLRDRLGAPEPTAEPLACPFPGARPFTADDATRFYGRRSEIDDLLGRLRRGESEIHVIGPRGSGKSSLLAAGLVARVKASPKLAGGRFVVCTMQPGSDPAAELGNALLIQQIPPTGGHAHSKSALDTSDATRRAIDQLVAHWNADRILIVIDQLDESFAIASREARGQLAALVARLRTDPRVVLLFAVRTDAYGDLLDSPLGPGPGSSVSRLDVTTPRGDALREAIQAPADDLDVYCEPALVEQLLADTADAPGALPRLQEALVSLWHRRMHGLLRLHDYLALRGATRRPALPVATQARHAVRRLIQLGLRRGNAATEDTLPQPPHDSQDWMMIAPLIAIALIWLLLRSC